MGLDRAPAEIFFPIRGAVQCPVECSLGGGPGPRGEPAREY